MTTRILIDDVRSFRDGREAIVARTVNEGVEVLTNAGHIDELWLDFMLKGTSSVDEILSELRNDGVKLDVDRVFVHSSAPMAYQLLSMLLGMLGVTKEKISVVNAYEDF